MRKIAVSLIFIVCASASAMAQLKRTGAVNLLPVEKRLFYQHELAAYAMPAYSCLLYHDADEQSSVGSWTVGVGGEYRFFPHQRVGLAVGAQWLPYSSTYDFDDYIVREPAVDNSDPLSPENPYQTVTHYFIGETARTHYLEVPLKLLFVTPSWNKMQFRAAVGMNLGWNIAANQILSGHYNRRLDYDDLYLTIDEADGIEVGTIPFKEKIPQRLLGCHVSALAEVGVGVKVSERWKINVDVFGSCTMNDTRKQSNPFAGVGDGYAGIISTDLVNSVKPVAVGARVGLSCYLGKQKEEILPPWKKRKLQSLGENMDFLLDDELLNPNDIFIDIDLTDFENPFWEEPAAVEAPEPEAETADEGQPAETIEFESRQVPVVEIKPDNFAETERKLEKLADDMDAASQLHSSLAVQFKFNSAEPTEELTVMLWHLTELLMQKPPKRITIVGHTCDIGDPKVNLLMGMRRAKTVKLHMEAYGLRRIAVRTRSMGDKQPRVPNTSDENRSLNRRIEMIYEY